MIFRGAFVPQRRNDLHLFTSHLTETCYWRYRATAVHLLYCHKDLQVSEISASAAHSYVCAVFPSLYDRLKYDIFNNKDEVLMSHPMPGSRYVGGYIGVGLQKQNK